VTSRNQSILFVGIKGRVVGIDTATGEEVWRQHLKGGDFVSVALEDGQVYAATHGELFCLDPSTGHIRWRNPLKGLGWGLVTIAPGGSPATIVAEKRRRQQQAAAAAAAT